MIFLCKWVIGSMLIFWGVYFLSGMRNESTNGKLVGSVVWYSVFGEAGIQANGPLTINFSL